MRLSNLERYWKPAKRQWFTDLAVFALGEHLLQPSKLELNQEKGAVLNQHF